MRRRIKVIADLGFEWSGTGSLLPRRAEQAARMLEEALSMWRGEALDDVRYEAFAQSEIGRLEELRSTSSDRCASTSGSGERSTSSRGSDTSWGGRHIANR